MPTNHSLDLVIRCQKALVSEAAEPLNLQERKCDIGIKDGKIVAIENQIESHSPVYVAPGSHTLPGLIDSQVHFRDPGAPQKEDFESGTLSAVLGGITAVFDMPNTKPNTSTPERFIEKREAVAKKAWCDFGLFAGATNDNSNLLGEMEKLEGCCGIKIFMGSSTGDLLVSEDQFLAKALSAGTRMVSVHCEDENTLIANKPIAEKEGHPRAHPHWRSVESALLATQRIVALARKAGRKIHTLHITTAEEMEFLKNNKEVASVEILPQHMYFKAPDCYEKLGSLAQMNPPIRDERHQKAIRQALQDRIVDVVASDHAPHTLEEKQKPYPQSPSGLTGVQTIVPVMLNFVNQGLIPLTQLVEVMSINPARIFKARGKGGIFIGQDADFSFIDLEMTQKVDNRDMATKAGWTPYHGEELKGWPVATMIRGTLIMENGKALTKQGQAIHFD